MTAIQNSNYIIKQVRKNELNEIKVSYTYGKRFKSGQRVAVKSSTDSYNLIQSRFSNINFQEEFQIMLLNNRNEVIGFYAHSIGASNKTIVDTKIIMGVALVSGATSMILVHNHPSGFLKPSQADKDMTKKLMDAAKLLELTILDHLIITESSYYSFADEGLI